MKKLNTSKIKSKEVVLWLGIVLDTALAFWVTSYFNFSGPIKAIVWILWFIIGLLFGFYTEVGKKIYSFVKDAKVELQKIVWPTREETIQTTSIVMIMVAITGFILWGIDSIMIWGIAKLTHLG